MLPRRLLLVTAALGCAACTTVLPRPNDEPERRTLTVASSATLHVPPDRACVALTFSETAPRLVDAHEQVEAHRRRYLERLAALDPELEVETGEMRHAPRYTRVGEERRLDGYRASLTLTVRTGDRAQIPELVRRAGDGLHEVDVTHYHSDLTSFRARLREMAVDAAREKARQLAEGFGETLGEVVTVGEGGARAAPRTYFAVDNAVAHAGGGRETEGPPPPGAIPLRLTIAVTFALSR
jgi:uncharacterized protein YggE